MLATPLVQDWTRYTDEDHDVWTLLYERRMRELNSTASRRFLEGIEAIGLRPDRVPNLTEINRRLAPRTGWCAVPVAGYLPAQDFFQSLAERQFPTTITVRPWQQLDYLPEPDIFHDVFGHVPLHSDPVFASYLQEFGKRAAAAHDSEVLTRLTRLFWFTVEFGLIRERGGVRIYGSGLISSIADAANALGSSCDRRPFVVADVVATDFQIDQLQPVLYVLDSFEQLYEALDEVA
jgi:phenylalanine-4-hydroxylase